MVRNQIEASNIDIFKISESWLSKAVPDRIIECKGYNVVRLDRSWNEARDRESVPKRGDGLLNFIKSDIKYSDTKYERLNVSCKDVEMLWLAVEISNMRPVVVVKIYRPPQGDHKCCNTLINEALERANLKDNTDIFLLGDFNINFADKRQARTRDLDFTTRALGLRQLIKTCTRTVCSDGEITETQLDLIFSNSDSIADARTLNYNLRIDNSRQSIICATLHCFLALSHTISYHIPNDSLYFCLSNHTNDALINLISWKL